MADKSEPRVYNQPSMRVIATHPETKEEVVVLVSKFEHSISAVTGTLGRLSIPFRMEQAN